MTNRYSTSVDRSESLVIAQVTHEVRYVRTYWAIAPPGAAAEHRQEKTSGGFPFSESKPVASDALRIRCTPQRQFEDVPTSQRPWYITTTTCSEDRGRTHLGVPAGKASEVRKAAGWGRPCELACLQTCRRTRNVGLQTRRTVPAGSRRELAPEQLLTAAVDVHQGHLETGHQTPRDRRRCERLLSCQSRVTAPPTNGSPAPFSRTRPPRRTPAVRAEGARRGHPVRRRRRPTRTGH